MNGIDHDPANIEMARKLVAEQGIINVTFQMGNALALPFEDHTFDAAFENNVFTHLASNTVQVAWEVNRVLKSRGVFATRDVNTEAVLRGHPTEALKQLDQLFIAWHHSRGSDITMGQQLPTILRTAGFIKINNSVSAETKGTPDVIRSHAEITLSLLDGPFGRDIVDYGWSERAIVEHLKETIQAGLIILTFT